MDNFRLQFLGNPEKEQDWTFGSIINLSGYGDH